MRPDTIANCPHCGSRNIFTVDAPHPARRLHQCHCKDCGCRVSWFVTRNDDSMKALNSVQESVHRIDQVSLRLSDVIDRSGQWLDQSVYDETVKHRRSPGSGK